MRRLFRAPVVALVLLIGVSVAYASDHPTPPTTVLGTGAVRKRPALVPRTSSTTTISSTTTSSTTSTTIVMVEGDDDPVAVDTRSWTWDQLADCESGSWGANKVPNQGTANWAATRAIYQGGLQFAAGTWDVYREPSFPADAQDATREQQIVVAEKVITRQGPRAWPTCAPRLGMIGPDLPLDDPVAPSVPLAASLP
jgi:hypothetical protein